MGKRFIFISRIGVYLVVLSAGLLMLGPAFSLAADTVCARVKIEIKQELTLERQAFDAHMRITNGLAGIMLDNVRVDVAFSDEDGNSVPAGSDPGNTDALFFIRPDSMENIHDIDGSGTVAPATTADIHWLIIPAPGSSNGLAKGTLYYVGARLTYTIGGEQKVTEVTPDYIFVKPMPELTLDYFLPADVYGDDPLTPEIEPVIPFSLGVRVKNSGYGFARQLKIDSAQPKIIENDQGLLIGFAIEGSKVNGEPAVDSLLVDFGDIAPGSAGTARWIMTCTLSGKFVSFSAEYSHSDELGGELTSLMNPPRTHFLVQDVFVDLPGRDAIRDFLARDGGVYRIYESETTGLGDPADEDPAVADQSAAASLQMSVSSGQLTAPATAGFMYVQINDPFAGQKVLKEVIRSDGKRIKPENAWLSKTRDGAQNWHYYANLFDMNSPGSYTLKFEEVTAVPQPPVLQFIQNKTGLEGQQISFLIHASDPNGTTPVLTAAPLPAGVVFTDQATGTGVFDWTPGMGQAGTYEITFKASDGHLADSRRVIVVIRSIDDTDGDGLPDAWEMKNFGSLDRDGSADFDEDGLSDLAEFLIGSNPAAEDHAPTLPAIADPPEGADVVLLQPDLVIENSTDEDGDLLAYEFEVFADPAMTVLAAASADVAETEDTTSWTLPDALNDNSRYYWRVRATDGYSFSLWTYGSFFVNTANSAPGPFNVSYPRDDSEVDTLTPVLEITNSLDVDQDDVTYTFEVYEDRTMSTPVASATGISQGPGGTTCWTVPPALADNTWYFWRVVAVDEHNARVETESSSFLVNTARKAPDAPRIAYPALNAEADALELDLAATGKGDTDSIYYYFELDKVNTFDGPARLASGEIPAGAEIAIWHVFGLEDNTRYFWRVKAGDEIAESRWTTGEFFVNTANQAPSVPTLNNPGHQAWVGATRPTLGVNPAVDPDDDRLSYHFEVYDDAELTRLRAQGESPTSQWTLPEELADKTRYYWRAAAEDEHGLAGDWMNAASFFVKDAGPVVPPAEIAVNVAFSTGRVLAGLKIYSFTQAGVYTGKSATTDESGTALFAAADFADGSYIFRVDYLGQQFWSGVLLLPGTYQLDVIINEETVAVAVGTGAGPVAGSKVYLFSSGGSYLGINSATDENGTVFFQLPAGIPFKFRADILGSQYWSDIATIETGGTSRIELGAGGGHFQVTLRDDAAMPLAGIRCYLFSAAGGYLGLNQATDSEGRVAFDVPEAIYKVRADYLGYQFWNSETQVVIDTNIDFAIARQDVAVTVNSLFQNTAMPLAGIQVYLFNPSGSYIGRYLTTDDRGQAAFYLPQQPYKIRADFLGQQYWSEVFTWTDTVVNIPMADVEISVIGGTLPVAGQEVYVFSAADSYLGMHQSTDGDGRVFFRLPEGEYKFRTDYQGGQFWSGVEMLAVDELNSVTLSTGGGSFTVSVLKGNSESLSGLKAYVFNTAGNYLGMAGATDSSGQVFYNLAVGNFKFRVDYLAHEFWSEEVTVPDVMSAEVIIAHQTTTVQVITGAGPVEGARVYLFSDSGSYLGRCRQTDAAGLAVFDLPVGLNFQFRADILDNPYWSEVSTVAGDMPSNVLLAAGGGLLQATVQKDEETPMPGCKVSLFNTAGTYLGANALTDGFGLAEFAVPAGTYKLRVDYLGFQFWSAKTLVAGDMPVTVNIPHMAVEITAQGLFQGVPVPIEGIKVYLFSPTDVYLGQNQITDAEGKMMFDLPPKQYKVRADYLGRQFWSEVFDWQHTPVNIPLADAQVTVTGAGFPRQDVKIYVFTPEGTYLGLSATTDAGGRAAWRLPAGAYKFRVDYQGHQYWSVEQTLTADLVNPVIVSVGGGSFNLTVLKSAAHPLEGVRCYVFNEQETYLGLMGAANSDGQVFFDLADGAYKMRVDHLGYQFWSPAYEVPDTLFAALDLGQQDVVVAVEGLYQTVDPLAGLKVYLFTPENSYLGQNKTTDADGRVTFSLPDRPYRIRVDYLGHQFWSDNFQTQNTTVTIHRGMAAVHASRSGFDAPGAAVYLFSENGSYLGWKETTDANGRAEFILPDRSFKFRVDDKGEQYWSDVVQIQAVEVNAVEVNFD